VAEEAAATGFAERFAGLRFAMVAVGFAWSRRRGLRGRGGVCGRAGGQRRGQSTLGS
jgi:hypothetical protein